ncbi:MAG: hypothetical protein LBS07_01360, partial [Prevotellaceae bacterium]|nr:hypothetical protein [Prevotellaceae bacterium]
MCIAAFVSQANATVYYVAPSGDGDGTSWNSPFGSIKTAYDKSDASEVRVKTGTYSFESITLKSGVHLLGGYTGNADERVSDPALTVWNGGASSVNRFITAPSANPLSTRTTVSGFTFQNNTSTANGGAILMRAFLTLENCIVSGNSATSGGGILINTDVAGDAIQILTCKIDHNNAATGGGGGITIGSGSDTGDVSIIIQDS